MRKARNRYSHILLEDEEVVIHEDLAIVRDYIAIVSGPDRDGIHLF